MLNKAIVIKVIPYEKYIQETECIANLDGLTAA